MIFPTYGLAEHTVYVCSNGRNRLNVDRIILETERKVTLLLTVVDRGLLLSMNAGGL